MRTQMLLKLHNRAQCILEMIEKADERAQDAARWAIKCRLNRLNFHDSVLPHYEQRLEANTEIKNRLVRYYADVMVRITKPVIERMENAKAIGDIKVNQDHSIQLNALS